MFKIEYGTNYSDAFKVIVSPEDWDKEMAYVSKNLADLVDSKYISVENFEQGMEWVTGVVVEDEDVRVSASFGNLTIAITFTEDDTAACDRCTKEITEEQCVGSQRRTGGIWCRECESLA